MAIRPSGSSSDPHSLNRSQYISPPEPDGGAHFEVVDQAAHYGKTALEIIREAVDP